MVLSTITPRRETALRGLVSGLLAVSILAHALLGCCWHHDHDHGEQGGGHASAVGGSGCNHDHCAELSREHQETPNSNGVCLEHHGPIDCESAACVAAVTLPERLGESLDDSASTVVGEVSPTGVEASAARLLLPDSGGPTTVRRHLLLQVWLA